MWAVGLRSNSKKPQPGHGSQYPCGGRCEHRADRRHRDRRSPTGLDALTPACLLAPGCGQQLNLLGAHQHVIHRLMQVSQPQQVRCDRCGEGVAAAVVDELRLVSHRSLRSPSVACTLDQPFGPAVVVVEHRREAFLVIPPCVERLEDDLDVLAGEAVQVRNFVTRRSSGAFLRSTAW